MLIQFTLQELMLYLLSAFGIVAGFIIIPILWDFKKVIGNLRALLEANGEGLKKTFRTMPVIFENAEKISVNVIETTNKLNISVPLIMQEVACVTNAAKGSIELAGTVMGNMGSGINETLVSYKRETPDLITYIHFFEELLQIIHRILTPRK